jgi:hypothetical protein
LSVGSSSSTISVTFPPAACTRVAPTVTLTPNATVYTAAGGEERDVLRVRCATTTAAGAAHRRFDVSAGVPAGWNADDGAHAHRRRRRESSSGTLTVTTAVARSGGVSYPVTVAATNTTAPATLGTAAGTIAINAARALRTPSDVRRNGNEPRPRTVYALPAKGSVNVQITTSVLNGWGGRLGCGRDGSV